MHVVKVFVKTAVPGDKLDSGSVVFSIVEELCVNNRTKPVQFQNKK